MTGYGAVARETAVQRHERLIEAIAAVLVSSYAEAASSPSRELRRVAEQCLDAVEAGF